MPQVDVCQIPSIEVRELLPGNYQHSREVPQFSHIPDWRRQALACVLHDVRVTKPTAKQPPRLEKHMANSNVRSFVALGGGVVVATAGLWLNQATQSGEQEERSAELVNVAVAPGDHHAYVARQVIERVIKTAEWERVNSLTTIAASGAMRFIFDDGHWEQQERGGLLFELDPATMELPAPVAQPAQVLPFPR